MGKVLLSTILLCILSIFLFQRNFVSAANFTTRPTFGLDSKGFITLNGQRFLPLSVYANVGKVEQFDQAADAGFNTVGFVDNIITGQSRIAKAASVGLYAHPGAYGDSPTSFSCDMRLPQEDSASHPECRVCSQVGKLCPTTCNYCNPDYVTAFVNQKKTIPNLISAAKELDEPSSHFSYLDPRGRQLMAVSKAADPTGFTATADFVLCAVEKKSKTGKWELQDRSSDIANHYCVSNARERASYAISYFKDPNLDFPLAESGYFAEPGDTGNFPLKDDIGQLIGVMEYFHQETGKPVGSVLQVSDDPTQDEIKSLFYASLGHQARLITVGLWSDDPAVRSPVLGKIKNTITELNNNDVIVDYLKSTDMNSQISSDKLNVIDATGFKTTENFYLIAINITKNSQSGNIYFPGAETSSRASILGTSDTLQIAKGQTSIGVQLLPHQTKVYKWSLKPAAKKGDANEDGRVNRDDYIVWKTNYGKTGEVKEGNFNESGLIDGFDYAVWFAGFGK